MELKIYVCDYLKVCMWNYMLTTFTAEGPGEKKKEN